MPDELIGTQVVPTEVEPKEKVDEQPVVSPELQAEIDRLENRKLELEKVAREAEEKAIYWRKQKAEARADFFKKGEEKPPEKEKVDLEIGPAPKKEDFDDYDSYVAAIADYRAEIKKAEWLRDETTKNQQAEYQKKIENLYTKLEVGYTKYADFEEVAKDITVPITPLIRDILAESEHPEDVAYYLGKNRAEAIKLSRMTPFAAAREIARIEAEVAKAPPSPNQPNQPKKISDATPPIKPLGSSDTVTKDPNKMTQKEYETWAKERGMRHF
jgi:hypothetical protein